MYPKFFLDVLEGNNQRIPVHAEQLIVDHYANHAVLASNSLDLREYARLGCCEYSPRECPRPLSTWYWGGEDHDDLYQNHGLVVWKVKWQEHELNVVQLRWENNCGGGYRDWVAAPSEEIGKAFILDIERKTNAPGEAILVFTGGRWKRSRAMYQATQDSSFDDLIMDDDLKQSIRSDFKQFLKSEEHYKKLGIAWRRGAIFIGPPGNGKTHCVRALVKELGVAVLYVQSLSHPHYTSEQLWGQVFERARQLRPCVLVLEDLDSLVKSDNRSYFLNQLDGFEKNHGMIVLATTNYPERIDEGIVDRPSRFDRKYHFDLPTKDERQAFLESWQERLAEETNWQNDEVASVADATDGYSFAYLKELVIGSVMRWLEDGESGFENTILTQSKHLKAQMKTEA